MRGRKHNKVAIISRESNEPTLDIRLLDEELQRRGIRTETLCRLLTKEKSLRSLGYIGHIFRQIRAIAGADVVVLDTYCIPVSMLPHRKGLKVIQMWHALSAVKKFGWQTVGKAGGSSAGTAKLMRMHRGYDYVVSASDITAEHFSEAFGTSADKIVKYGLPRIDYIKRVSSGILCEETAARICAKYPQIKKRNDNLCCEGQTGQDGSPQVQSGTQAQHGPADSIRTILYAPTFRKGKAVDVQSLLSALGTERYNVVVKLHPLYRGAAAESVQGESGQGEGGQGEGSRRDSSRAGSIIYDDDFSSDDWLSVADIIISDYSSFVIESTLADKPLYIYAYDIEDYSENTGLNIDFDSEPIAKYVFRDAEELAAALEEPYDYDALRQFRDRYIDIDTSNCTGQLAGFIESLLHGKQSGGGSPAVLTDKRET